MQNEDDDMNIWFGCRKAISSSYSYLHVRESQKAMQKPKNTSPLKR